MNQSKKHLARLTAFMLVAGMSVPYVIPADVQVKELNVSAEEAASELSAADLFISNPVESKNCTSYFDGSSSFQMNGRTYYQGITFENRDPVIVFDVENVNSISFTPGMMDDQGYNSETIIIYKDDVPEEVKITSDIMYDERTIDVSGCKTLKICSEDGYTAFALAEISIDGVSPARKFELPEYKDTADLINRAYNKKEIYETYDGTQTLEHFNMNGRTYYQGISLDRDDSFFMMNVENLSALSFTIGHIDDKSMEEAEISIFLDNKLYKNKTIKWAGGYPLRENAEMTIPVSDVKTVRICKSGWGSVAIANIQADELGNPNKYTDNYVLSPYSDSAALMNRFYDLGSFTKVYDGSGIQQPFQMGGRLYNQGCLLGNASLNVENVDTISFDLGHIDNNYRTNEGEYELIIKIDNKPQEPIKLSPDMLVENHTVDVSGAKTLSFSIDSYYNYYGIGNIIADTIAPDNTFEIPAYDTPEDFIDFAYDLVSAEKHTDEFNTFSMNGKDSYGITLSSDKSQAVFNVEKLGAVSFTAGVLDNDTDGDYTSTLEVYVDNKKVKTIELKHGMPAETYTFNVSEVSKLRVKKVSNWLDCGLTDFVLSAEAPAVSSEDPIDEPSPEAAVPTATAEPTTAPTSSTAEPTAVPAQPSAPASTEPTAVPSPSPKPLADLTGDGKASTSDVRTLIKSIIGEIELTDEQKIASDLDGDGKVDSVDAVLYLKRVVETVAEKEYR
ncbi:MAG: hypothetical protein IKN85_05695 [Oscillospiraceae bacterium]|nr:hypothetical protein [Oscillospiraceae bacterium]MBR6835062.1 hypothetical protein [Oscillospiraceae bacterium]